MREVSLVHGGNFSQRLAQQLYEANASMQTMLMDKGHDGLWINGFGSHGIEEWVQGGDG